MGMQSEGLSSQRTLSFSGRPRTEVGSDTRSAGGGNLVVAANRGAQSTLNVKVTKGVEQTGGDSFVARVELAGPSGKTDLGEHVFKAHGDVHGETPYGGSWLTETPGIPHVQLDVYGGNVTGAQARTQDWLFDGYRTRG